METISQKHQGYQAKFFWGVGNGWVFSLDNIEFIDGIKQHKYKGKTFKEKKTRKKQKIFVNNAKMVNAAYKENGHKSIVYAQI